MVLRWGDEQGGLDDARTAGRRMSRSRRSWRWRCSAARSRPRRRPPRIRRWSPPATSPARPRALTSRRRRHRDALSPGRDRKAPGGRRRRADTRRQPVLLRLLASYQASYDPAWGAAKAVTHPVPGTREYQSPNAAGYFDYFNGPGAQTGRPALGDSATTASTSGAGTSSRSTPTAGSYRAPRDPSRSAGCGRTSPRIPLPARSPSGTRRDSARANRLDHSRRKRCGRRSTKAGPRSC